MGEPAIDVNKLTPAERLELIGLLWDSLQDTQTPVSDGEKRILDERMERIEREGPTGTSWDEVKARWMRERNSG